MFEIKNITKQFGSEAALKDVSFKINGGMNFIIGSSGSGKTTLLKILCAMDQEFSGEAYYNGKSLKELGSKDKGSYYANEFGFVWQDFNLIEDLSVFENIKLPLYLNEKPSNKLVINTMKELKIYDLANQKVRNLSGGQKQRVAIARELVKNPEVIIADEPTAALDSKSAVIIMNILKEISKTKTVIVVTHDTSFVDNRSSVFKLDKGELISEDIYEESWPVSSRKAKISKISFSRAISLAKVNVKSKLSRYAVLIIGIIVSASFLLVSVSGSIQSGNQETFDETIKTYGQGILDISVVGSISGASGSDGKDGEKPNMDVTQDIGGLHDKYLNDSRVEHVLLIQAVDNIKISLDGKNYNITGSGSIPMLEKMVAGKMPKGEGKEVVVPESFVKMIGITNEDAISKSIDFKGNVYNWESGNPVQTPINLKLTIVGVANTTTAPGADANAMEFTIEDAFFFSKTALEDIRKQGGIKNNSMNFSMRMKTPADVISVKDELSANGIVPLGMFEIIEDLVRLDNQSKDQVGSTSIVIALLSIAVSIAISGITVLLRKKEYAIYKINGYSKSDIVKTIFGEYTIILIASISIFIITSPIINMGTKQFFNVNIISGKLLATCIGIIILISILCIGVTTLIGVCVKEEKCLKSGDR
ncbi:MAG: ABC transporter ATP-binding protein/permease [Clostridium sp.]